MRLVISIAVLAKASFVFVVAVKVEVERLMTRIGSLEEERLGALGGLARLDLLEERGGGPLAVKS